MLENGDVPKLRLNLKRGLFDYLKVPEPRDESRAPAPGPVTGCRVRITTTVDFREAFDAR